MSPARPSAIAGIAQLAGLLLPLAACAGRSDKEPVSDEDGNDERCDAFQQLPTCAHPTFLFPAESFSPGGSMLLAPSGRSKVPQ